MNENWGVLVLQGKKEKLKLRVKIKWKLNWCCHKIQSNNNIAFKDECAWISNWEWELNARSEKTFHQFEFSYSFDVIVGKCKANVIASKFINFNGPKDQINHVTIKTQEKKCFINFYLYFDLEKSLEKLCQESSKVRGSTLLLTIMESLEYNSKFISSTILGEFCYRLFLSW